MKYILLIILLLLLMLANIVFGTVSIPVDAVLTILLGGDCGNDIWRYIIIGSRLPQTITAVLSGMSLSVCGLMLQTVFRNPLADPSILGISSGASLGVALVTLFFGGLFVAGSFSIMGYAATVIAAFVGAVAVILLIMFFSSIVRNHVLVLIIGIMIGYLSSSAITLLNYFATQEGVKTFSVWSMGSFSGVTLSMLPWFACLSIVALLLCLMLIKPLNALLLGDNYASNLGYDIKRLRHILLAITGVVTAVITSVCGPVSFIGLAVPHLARLTTTSDNHLTLMPVTILIGGIVALACNIVTAMPGDGTIIPINAVTPLVGAPVIIWVIMRGMVKKQ